MQDTGHVVIDHPLTRAATAGKAGKVGSLPRFWVAIRSHKKQPVKTFWGRILNLAWLKFAKWALLTSYHTGQHPLRKIKSGNIQNYQTFIKHGMSSMIRSIR